MIKAGTAVAHKVSGVHKTLCRLFLAAIVVGGAGWIALAPTPAAAQAGKVAADGGHVFSPEEVQGTFPPSVYFQGRSAPLQLRNAAAIRFAGDAIFFAGLVDSSGYASSVQEKYQMYVICERPTLFGGKLLQAGAYGAGFVGERFLVMDLGGRNIAEGQTQTDAQMARPRPLQLLQPGKASAKLYLGKRWVSVELSH